MVLPASAQLGPVPLAGQAVQAAGATLARPLAQKLSDQLSVLDFGAACDGKTDDSAAVTAASQSGRRVVVPGGRICNAPSVAQGAMAGVFIGGGQIKGSDGYPRGPQFAAVRLAPNPQVWNASTNAQDNCSGSFQCWARFDYSHTLGAEEYHISGAATLGQPAHNYETMPGTSPHTLLMDSSSGWNQSHNSNDGRTGAMAYGGVFQNNGAGDFGVFGAHIQCSGYLPPGDGNTTPGPDGSIVNGYTDWLAVPGCGFIGATLDAYNPGQYLQIGEFPVEDNGNDVSAIGWEEGYRRTATTAKLNNRWIHELTTCNAGLIYTLPCDAHTLLGGSWFLGYATIGATVTAPVAMSANQKITLNGNVGSSVYAEGNPPLKYNLGGDWLTSDGSGVVLAQNGSTAVRLYNNPGAVNYIQIAGSVAGSALTINAAGADSQIPLVFNDKGGAGVVVESNGSIAMGVVSAAGSTGYLHVTAGTAGSALLLQDYSSANQDMALGAAGTGLVRINSAVPGAADSSTAVATTAFTQAAAKTAVMAATGNRYKILNVGSGAAITVPVPSGVLNQMIVEIEPNAATIASMVLTMPAGSAIPDGFVVHFICSATITSFTLSGNTGQTVLGGPSSIGPGTPVAFMWDAALADWIAYR